MGSVGGNDDVRVIQMISGRVVGTHGESKVGRS